MTPVLAGWKLRQGHRSFRLRRAAGGVDTDRHLVGHVCLPRRQFGMVGGARRVVYRSNGYTPLRVLHACHRSHHRHQHSRAARPDAPLPGTLVSIA